MPTIEQPVEVKLDGQSGTSGPEEEHAHRNDYDPERRLWTAVLLQAVQDWQSNNVRAHREAESFLFKRPVDLESICYRAGLNPAVFQSKLKRVHHAKPLAGLPRMAMSGSEHRAANYRLQNRSIV